MAFMLPRLWINRSWPCMSMYVILLKQNILIFLVGVVFSDAHIVEDTGKHVYRINFIHVCNVDAQPQSWEPFLQETKGSLDDLML